MSEPVKVERIKLHADARGVVFEPLGPEALPAQRNAHVVITEPGHVRGNHGHRRGTEILTAMGPALIRLREGTDIRDIAVPEGEVYRLVLPPGIPHAIQNTGPRPTVLVSFNTLEHDPANPDVFREALIPDGK